MRATQIVLVAAIAGFVGWVANDLSQAGATARCQNDLSALQEWVAGDGREPGSPWYSEEKQ
jgi:hypothetical protein